MLHVAANVARRIITAQQQERREMSPCTSICMSTSMTAAAIITEARQQNAFDIGVYDSFMDVVLVTVMLKGDKIRHWWVNEL